jgi:hypothetical protein
VPGVREAQQVGGDVGVGLQRLDELVRRGVGVVGQRADADQRLVEDGELAETLDAGVQTGRQGRVEKVRAAGPLTRSSAAVARA